MPDDTDLRKRRFRAALGMAGMTAEEFALSVPCTPQHLSFVLSGKRASARVVAAIEQFIRTQSVMSVTP